MAKKIYNPATFEQIIPCSLTTPPEQMTSGHFLTQWGYRVVRPKGAGNWLLFYTVKGSGRFQQPGIQADSIPGEIHLLSPNAYNDYGTAPTQHMKPIPNSDRFGSLQFIRQLHTEAESSVSIKSNGWQFHWVHFQPENNWSSLLKLPALGKGLGYVHIEDPNTQKRIIQAFERIHRDLLTEITISSALGKTAVMEILTLAAAQSVGRPVVEDSRIRKVLELIQDNPNEPHTVGSLAEAVNLSPSRFAHLFKEKTGVSVMQTILGNRIRQAARLLTMTDERISDIAYSLGFYSPYIFSKQFKDRYGMSPRTYRNNKRRM